MKVRYIVARDKETGKIVSTLAVAYHHDVETVLAWMNNRLKPTLKLRLEDAPR